MKIKVFSFAFLIILITKIISLKLEIPKVNNVANKAEQNPKSNNNLIDIKNNNANNNNNLFVGKIINKSIKKIYYRESERESNCAGVFN
jgi:hypothetical protein